MASVLRQALYGYRIGIGAVALSLFAVSFVLVYTFDAFGGVETFEELMKLVPESLRALLKAQGGFASDANEYLSAQYRHPLYLIATCGLVIALATGAVAREVERGTALMLLAAPIARWRYLAAKLGALLAGLLVVLAAIWLGTGLGVLITGAAGEVQMSVFLRVLVNLLALALAVGGISALLSAMGSDGGQTIGIAAGIAAAMFFVDFLATLWAPAEPLGPLSLFHYYDPLKVAKSRGLPWRDMGVLLGVAAAGFSAALFVFQRRDIVR